MSEDDQPALVIRAWNPADAPAVAALSERYFAPDPAWSAETAVAQLTADALGGGAHVRVAERGGRVVGVVGFVCALPWLYVYPLAADDEAAAGALFDAAVELGRRPGLTHARVSTRSVEPHKRAAIEARGLVRSIDFIEVARRSTPPLSAAAVAATPRRGRAIDRAAMHELHDRAFAEIPNTTPMTAADFAVLLDGPVAWPEPTAAWHDADGRCVGFVIGVRAPDHGVVEAIGVDPAWRGRGLGRAMLADLLAIGAASGVSEVRAGIASTNAASLALHLRAGFVERARKQLWDLRLVAPFELRPIGVVRSAITQRSDAPRQGAEGAPDAWIDLDADLADALDGLRVGDEVVVITWLHLADRDTRKVHPRGDTSRLYGVFATRSPDRPNPLGLHRVTVRAIDGTRVQVGPLEAIDGTPVVDVKIVLSNVDDS